MTEPAATPARAFASIDEVFTLLRAEGHRVTPAARFVLDALGVVRHVHLGHGPSLYLLVGAGEREFLLCERCGAVRSLEPRQLDPVRRAIEKRFGYRARFSHFPIVGLCQECAARSGD